jgi:signal transduction histidine kinase
VGAVAHEIRNPLVPIRTLAQLLPQHFDDPEFRERFAQQVGSDVERITETLDRMAGFAGLGPPESRSVDIAALLDALLDARRDEIRERRLLVLKELDRTQPNVPADPEHLRFAFGALLDKALSWMPERGDLYLASKHHSSLLRGLPSVRILMRFHSPLRIAPLRDAAGVSLTENALEVVIAETLIRGLGGRLTIDSTDGEETVAVVDLPA